MFCNRCLVGVLLDWDGYTMVFEGDDTELDIYSISFTYCPDCGRKVREE